MANVNSSEKRDEIINTWSFAPEVASAALHAGLTKKIDISDQKAANRRRDVLSSILSIEPLSSLDWLSLSGVQLVTDQPMGQVLGSLELSMLTGRNEGYVMAERGIFGISLWESLSPYLKTRVANDLAAGEIVPRTLGPFFPHNPSGCGTRSGPPCSQQGFRQKRSSDDWDFRFRGRPFMGAWG